MNTTELPFSTIILLISSFVIGLIFISGNLMINGYVHPMVKSMNPNSTIGITEDMYDDITEYYPKIFWVGGFVFMSIPFIYFIVRVFFQKENTSVGYGGY